MVLAFQEECNSFFGGLNPTKRYLCFDPNLQQSYVVTAVVIWPYYVKMYDVLLISTCSIVLYIHASNSSTFVTTQSLYIEATTNVILYLFGHYHRTFRWTLFCTY